MCLAGLAGLAMRESPASAGIISSTGPIIAIFADELFLGGTRLSLHSFDKELFSHIDAIEHGQQKVADKARQTIRDNLTQISALCAKQKYMLGDEFSMLDVAVAPLLWRLDHYGIKLGKEAEPLMKYAERIFSRPAYIKAMTPAEKAMRK